jgi:hypothetical protein
MKRLLVVFALLLTFSSSAWAEWVEIGSAADDSFILYANPSTIRKNGSMVKMWILHDLVNGQGYRGKTYFSSRAQTECDCQGERFRILAFSSHSGKMGRGDTVYLDNTPSDPWSPVAPGSIAEIFWKFACGK